MTETDTQPPAPDPVLRRLEPLVGDWSMTGNLVGSSEENIVGRASFRGLEGGFFLQQDIEIDFAGQFQVKSHELIGYDPETGAFASHVYSNLSPTPLPYAWELRDNKLRISVSHGPLDATFEGTISDVAYDVPACREAPARGDAHIGSELTGGRRTELGGANARVRFLRRPFRVRSAEGSRAMPVRIRSSVAIRFSSSANRPSSANPPVEDADASGSVASGWTAWQEPDTTRRPPDTTKPHVSRQFWALPGASQEHPQRGSNPCLHPERAAVLLR
jgi:Protein of unknown function (DUF1579)